MDAAVGAGAELQTAPACGFEPAGAVLPGEPQNAQTGSKALLRMRPAFENDRRQFGGVGANGGGVTPDAIDRPAGIAAMGARHVFRQRGVAAADAAAHMAGDALTFVEQLDRALGDARLDLFLQQAMRHRVVVAVDIDVVIETDPAQSPLGINVGLAWQPIERRPIEFLEQTPPADAKASHRPLVQIDDQPGDRGIELAQREEALVSQPGQDPALDHQNAGFDPRLREGRLLALSRSFRGRAGTMAVA